MATPNGWLYWAILPAVFAALTAIFAKIGIQGVDFDLATLIPTAIIIVVLSVFVACSSKWSNPFTIGHYQQAVHTLTELALQTDKGIVLASVQAPRSSPVPTGASTRR